MRHTGLVNVNGAPHPGYTIARGEGPPGDNRVNSGDIVAILGAGFFENGQYAAVKDTQEAPDANVVVSYDAADGNMSVQATQAISSVQIESGGAVFTGDAANLLSGPFDVDTDVKIFTAVFGGGFNELMLGTVAQSGLTKDFLKGDLTISGSLQAGGTYDSNDVALNYVPEPSTTVLLALGLVGVVSCGWRRRT